MCQDNILLIVSFILQTFVTCFGIWILFAHKHKTAVITALVYHGTSWVAKWIEHSPSSLQVAGSSTSRTIPKALTLVLVVSPR